ncbi:MAG: hypothetical protein PVG65_00735 [Candidatus Thorarchaeota archaeon]
MVSTDIPIKIGPDFLMRTIVPGLAVAAISSKFVIQPFIPKFWDSLNFGDQLLTWVFFGFFIGLFFLLCDSYIYQILEGSKFWPQFLWKWKYNRTQKCFQKLDRQLRDLIKYKKEKFTELETTDIRELSSRISRLSARVREFPPAYEKKNFSKRYPICPTRFGNVLCEYENYSLNRYGIHMMIFWNHLSQLLHKGIKDELNLRGAIADLCVYLCFASLVYTITGPIALLLREESWVVLWTHPVPAGSLLHFSLSIIVFRFFYNLSITQHKSYGRLVKSIFDLYRGKLAEKLGIKVRKTLPTSKKELEEDKALWKKYQNYYLDYKFIE